MIKKEVLSSIDTLCSDIDKCVASYIRAKTFGDNEMVEKHLAEMGRLIVSANQELSFLRDYIDENIKEE